MKKFITITLAFIIALSIQLAVYVATYIGNSNRWKFHYQDCQYERIIKVTVFIFLAVRKLSIEVWLPAMFVILIFFICSLLLTNKNPAQNVRGLL